jgi:hypothetical protein
MQHADDELAAEKRNQIREWEQAGEDEAGCQREEGRKEGRREGEREREIESESERERARKRGRERASERESERAISREERRGWEPSRFLC